jgi:hypothetical protein
VGLAATKESLPGPATARGQSVACSLWPVAPQDWVMFQNLACPSLDS